MMINKFQGKTKEEAIELAQKEFGPGAVIMNVKEIKPKGLFKSFKSSTYEVTAAMEEKENSANPFQGLKELKSVHETINLSADEPITIPGPEKREHEAAKERGRIKESLKMPGTEGKSIMNSSDTKVIPEKSGDKAIEKRLENLSNMLEEKLGTSKTETETPVKQNATAEELNFVKILYSTLLKNEVNEKYINQIMEEIEKFIRPGNSLDVILSNVYQKMILRFGQPKTIDLTGKKPKVILFVGPTGVGKTTTIAKIASKYKVEYKKKVAFLTADTYRIAASEQLRVYANILDAPMTVTYSAEDVNSAVAQYSDSDLVFVDTAGFSHKNSTQRDDMKTLISGISDEFDKEVYLVLSATTKYQDLMDIVDMYREICSYKLIFTKLDETTTYGNLLNIKLYSETNISYVTTGQNVPDDIEVFDTQKIVKHLLGGK